MMTTRRKFGLGIAAMLAAQRAPAALVRSLVAGRQTGIMGMRFVEYLESTGTQYIDTGFRMTSDNMKFECDMMRTSNGGAANFFYGYRFVSSASPTGDMRAFFLFGSNPIGRIAVRYGNGGFNSTNVVPINVKVRVAFDGSTVTVDGVNYVTVPRASASPTYGNMYLWDCNTGEYYRSDVLRFVGRFYNFKIWRGDEIVRDYQPLCFTNSLGQTEGAMFDRVSGQLFRNAGTGAFVIGPDK